MTGGFQGDAKYLLSMSMVQQNRKCPSDAIVVCMVFPFPIIIILLIFRIIGPMVLIAHLEYNLVCIVIECIKSIAYCVCLCSHYLPVDNLCLPWPCME